MSMLAQPLALEALSDMVASFPLVTAQAHEDKLRFVADMATPESMSALLNGLLGDEDALDAMARRSYRHVNHFDKIVLVDADPVEGYRLTLHLWRPPYSTAELNEEMIHDHRFSFWSAIVAGTLVSENFVRAPDGHSFRQYSYATEGRASIALTNFYRFVGTAVLRSQPMTVREAGDAYFLPYERIHRVLLPRDAITCTLVLRGARERPCSNVYNTSYPATSVRMANRPFSPAELVERLQALLGALSAEVK